MGRFIYRMQNILQLKEKLEDREKQNFALMQAKLNEEEALLASLRAKLEEIIEEGKRLRIGEIDTLRIKENERSQKDGEERVNKQMMQVRAAEKNLEVARRRMQEAMQERKIHEKLRENAFEKFLKEEAAQEAKEIDELTSYTYGRKATEKSE